MSREPLDHTGAADWLVAALPEFRGRVGDVATDLFPAYARIFHRPDQGLPGSDHPPTWAAIARARGTVLHPAAQYADVSREWEQPETERIPGPLLGSLDRATLPLLLGHLAAHTTTPEVCWSALWVGFGGLPERWQAKPSFRLPGRQYWLFSSAVPAVVELSVELAVAGWPEAMATATREMGLVHSPTIWWPDDRAWLVHSEIDYDSTIVAGSPALIRALTSDPGLEALQVDREVSLYANGDTVNGSYPSGWPDSD